MALNTRKVKSDYYGFYITVNSEKHYLKVGKRVDGLEGHEDASGSYVIIDGEKYYIYLGDKKDSKLVKKESTDNIDVLVFDGVKFKKKSIKGELEDFQKLVGGLIEYPYFATNIDKAGIYWGINEEGTYTSPSTLLFIDKNGKTVGKVHGTIVFSRVDENGKAKGLSEMDIKFIKKQFHLTLQRDAKTGNLLYSVVTYSVNM